MTAGKKPLQPRILFEDAYVIVLSKPVGMLSQGGPAGDDPNVVDWLRDYFGRPYVGLIHRLDRDTSGIMVVAKRTKGAQRLSEALRKGELDRTYLAWLHGTLTAPLKWKHSLLKDGKTNTVKAVSPRTPGAKPAALALTPVRQALWQGRPVTLVELQLETGRSHQIRVQSACEGHGVLGDPKYGKNGGENPNFSRLALHSHRLRFPHPIGAKIMEFEDPLPPELEIEKLR